MATFLKIFLVFIFSTIHPTLKVLPFKTDQSKILILTSYTKRIIYSYNGTKERRALITSYLSSLIEWLSTDSSGY